MGGVSPRSPTPRPQPSLLDQHMRPAEFQPEIYAHDFCQISSVTCVSRRCKNRTDRFLFFIASFPFKLTFYFPPLVFNWEERLRNDLFCAKRHAEPYLGLSQ